MFGIVHGADRRYIPIVSLVFFLVHCFGFTSIVRGENIVGYVSEVRGSAVISREEQKAILQNLNVNSLIFVSSLITVYESTVVVISLREGSIVEIGENSEFNFRKASELAKTRKFQYEFRLNSGKVNLILNSRVTKATLRTDDLALVTQSESIIQISKDTKGTSLGNAVSDIRVTNEKGSPTFLLVLCR